MMSIFCEGNLREDALDLAVNQKRRAPDVAR